MTTSLTIYGFGLRGNSANESIGKHRLRTKKHQKVNKSSQKTMAYLFGNWRPWVQVPPLRPKRPLKNGLYFLLVERPGLSPQGVLRRLGNIVVAPRLRKTSPLPTPYFLRSRRRKQLSTVSDSLTRRFDQKDKDSPCGCPYLFG